MTSGDGHRVNIRAMQELAARAAGDGAALLCLPEVAGLMNRDAAAAAKLVGPAQTDPFILACREAAAAEGLWIQPGSTPVAGTGGRFLNRAVLIDPRGGVVAEYDKIHLFDVALEGRTPIGESKRFDAGTTGVIVRTPLAVLGMSICYDLRFPALYRDYALAGAEVMLIPSAFTVPTGRAHWEVLLRARAIETGSFVVAAAQAGRHADGRETWGHSMVVGPWGEVMLDMGGGAGPGLAIVELDLAEVARARAQIPNLATARDYALHCVTAK